MSTALYAASFDNLYVAAQLMQDHILEIAVRIDQLMRIFF
jgi:hypothetical protein